MNLLYVEFMGERNTLDIHPAEAIFAEEDDATLAAIDEGILAASEGRLTPEEEVRKLLPSWISEFSTPARR